MKEVLFFGTLVLFVIAGACSAVLVATDWNSLASGDSFAGLGVLLFLIGAGIGAVMVMVCLWILRKYRKRNKEAVDDVIGELPYFESKENKDAQVKGTYNIHVHHMETENCQGIKMSDASLLNKLGLGVKSVMDKVSKKMVRWDSDSSGAMFEPARKSWDKGSQSMDGTTAPTPRIYVLPPESLSGPGAGHVRTSSHYRSRSGIPLASKLGVPDATILEIKPDPTIEEGDIDSGSSHQLSRLSSAMSVHEYNSESELPKQPTSLALPAIHPIDTHLGYFVQTLNQSENRLTYMLSIMIEEVLPRPDSGLLKRMLRMSEIPVGVVEGSGEPILHLRVGSECHVSIGLIKINGESSPIDISGPHSIKLKPLDGEAADLNTTCEAVDNIEHVSSAIWDLRSHASDALSRAEAGDSASTVLTPIEMTLGFHVHYHNQDDFIREIEVKKTFMASMRRELTSLDVDQRFMHEDAVLDFVLSKMELISMPSLLMFLELDTKPPLYRSISSDKT